MESLARLVRLPGLEALPPAVLGRGDFSGLEAAVKTGSRRGVPPPSTGDGDLRSRGDPGGLVPMSDVFTTAFSWLGEGTRSRGGAGGDSNLLAPEGLSAAVASGPAGRLCEDGSVGGFAAANVATGGGVLGEALAFRGAPAAGIFEALFRAGAGTAGDRCCGEAGILLADPGRVAARSGVPLFPGAATFAGVVFRSGFLTGVRAPTGAGPAAGAAARFPAAAESPASRAFRSTGGAAAAAAVPSTPLCVGPRSCGGGAGSSCGGASASKAGSGGNPATMDPKPAAPAVLLAGARVPGGSGEAKGLAVEEVGFESGSNGTTWEDSRARACSAAVSEDMLSRFSIE